MAAGTTHILTEALDFLQTEADGVNDNHLLQEAVGTAIFGSGYFLRRRWDALTGVC
jgi:hypothetical protein